MDDRIQKRLNIETSANDVNGNVFEKINVVQTQKQLPLDPINVVIDESEEFNNERQKSKCYRVISTIIPNVRNTLFDNQSWSKLRSFKDAFINSGGDTLANQETYDLFLYEENGWFGYKTPEVVASPDKPCTFYEFSPKKNDLYPLNNLDLPNWTVKLTRPAAKVTPTNSIVDGGLLIVDSSQVVIGGRDMLLLTTPVKHNLTNGSIVKINGFTPGSFDKEYKVIKLGDVVGDKSEYIFGIDATITPPSITINTRIKRIVGGKESEYYYRRFDVIDNSLYADMYKLPMAKQIYSDDLFQITFDDLDLSNIIDYLNRPVTELYISIAKIPDAIVTEPKSGIDIPYIPNMNSASYSNISDIHRVNESPTSNPSLDANILPTNTSYIGDVVEYNEYEVTETVLADVHHSFNTNGRLTSGSLGPRYEGYYYKAHHKLKIKDFSNYIEQGDASTDIIPDYAVDLGDGRFLWRDILDIGVNNGQDETLDYPFTNGCHYLHSNICINLLRQDPFSLYGLYYGVGDEPDQPGIIYETRDIETKDDNSNC